jgi:hypothetical protein
MLPSPEYIEINSEQLTLFCYLYITFAAALKLEPSPIATNIVLLLHICAKCVPTAASLLASKPHYFESLSE